MEGLQNISFKFNLRIVTLALILVILLEFAATQTTGTYDDESESEMDDRATKYVEEISRKVSLNVIFYFLGAVYTFGGLILTCAYFFVPSLLVLVEKLGIEDDVAGATFMGIGLSLHTLLVSILVMFTSHDDMSPFESVTGESLWHILLVVGLCAIVGQGFVPLSVWPIIRDSTFYFIGLVTTALIYLDGLITWYESVAMLGIFLAYILSMKFDTGLRNRLDGTSTSPNEPLANEVTQLVGSSASVETPTVVPGAEVKGQGLSLTWPEGNPLKRVAHVIFFPMSLLLYCTLPDVSTGRGRRFYPWAFCGSILWTAILSEVLIWTANVTGEYRSFSEVGQYLVAGAAASPVLIASLVLARKGKGAMIAHAGFGSVIFKIYVRAMLPVLIFSLVFSQPLHVVTGGMKCQFGLLFVMLCLFILTLVSFRRKMSRGFGILVLIYFFLFTTGLLLLEFHVVACN